PAQRLEAVIGRESVGRARLVAAADDLPRHGIERSGLALDEVADCGITLGHPGALVKKTRGFEKRLEVDLDHPRAQLPHQIYCGLEQPLSLVVAEKGEIGASRHTDPARLDVAGNRRR